MLTKIGKIFGAGFLLVLFMSASLLLVACGDNSSSAISSGPTTSVIGAASTTPLAASMPGITPTSPATPASGTKRSELIVYAAASLTESFNQIKTAFEQANPGVTITYNYGGSNQLAAQILSGAPADVFASADQLQMDKAFQGGGTLDKGQIFVKNRLVVIYPKNNPGGISKLQDLAKAGLRLDLAQQSVPVGNYSRAAFDKMSADSAFGSDFKAKVLKNLVSEETDVKLVVKKVQLGEADAGIVYTSDVTPQVSPDLKTLEIPDQFNTVAAYPIAVTKGSQQPDLAKKFINYVLSDKGQAVLKSHNFIPVVAAS